MTEEYQEGYEAALKTVRNAIRLHQMGVPDCEIVRLTELSPDIVHAIAAASHDGGIPRNSPARS